MDLRKTTPIMELTSRDARLGLGISNVRRLVLNLLKIASMGNRMSVKTWMVTQKDVFSVSFLL